MVLHEGNLVADAAVAGCSCSATGTANIGEAFSKLSRTKAAPPEESS